MENLTQWLTIASLMLTAIALIFSAVQTYQSRLALLKTEKALALSTHVRQVEALDRMNFVIALQVALQGWIKTLSEDHKKINSGIQNNDPNPIIHISNSGLNTPAHLVERHFADNAPTWATELMFCGASYYYNAQSTYKSLWNEKTKEVNFDYSISVQNRIEDSLKGLRGLNLLIENTLPNAIMDCPASLNNEQYLGD
jgi:hypothetical protein